MKTLFKKIIDKELPADIVYEDDICMVFKDINPAAPIHLLMIPKKEIAALRDINDGDKDLMGHMMMKIVEVAKHVGIHETGYRVMSNIDERWGQTVPHLHFHILGGDIEGLVELRD